MKMNLNNVALIVFVVSSLALSCKKSDSVKTEESPFFNFLQQSGIKIDTIKSSANTWDYGFQFSPLVNGKITKLGIKMPITGSFKVRLWDVTKDSVISEQTISEAQAHAETFVTINAVKAVANANLGVTITANAFYKVTKTDGTPFSFPVKTGNINITAYKEATTTSTTTFPPNSGSGTVDPCVNVTFVAD